MKNLFLLSAVLILNSFLLVPSFAQQGGADGPANGPAPGGSAQIDADLNQRLQRIDKMVNERMAEQNVPGYCLTVIKNGQVIFHKPYGFADLANRVPITNQTVFGLASLTKTFTGLTLLSLVDKGMVGLDDPLSKYINALTRPYSELTIRQLASMAGGVPEKLSKEVLWKDQMEILDHTPLVSQPGTEFLYSNFSYRLIGQVIANVTGKDYLDVVGETVLGPLGMNSTATTVLLEKTGRVALPYGDEMGKGPLRQIEYKNPRISFAAGMLATTSDDLVRYVQGLCSRKIISDKGYNTLWFARPALTSGKPCPWAFGWNSAINKSFGDKLTVSMNGGTPGVASSIILIPESCSAIIALSNLRKPPVYAIAKTAARMAFGTQDEAETQEEIPGGNGSD